MSIKYIKPSAIYIFLLLSVFVCSCTDYRYPHQLVVADSLSDVNPDSARVFLASMKTAMAKESEAVRNYYSLMCIKADDKAYITHTSDTAIMRLVSYYEYKGDNNVLPTAYYYAGRVYSDLNDAPLALDYFQKAIDLMEANSKSAKMLNKVYSQKASILLVQRLYDESIEVFKKALNINIQRSDTTSILFNLRDIGYAYKAKEVHDSALIYFNKAVTIAEKQGNKMMISDLQGQITSIYLHKNEINKADEAFKKSRVYHDPNNQSAILSIEANLLTRKGMIDSALVCYRKVLDVGNVFSKKTAYRQLADYYIKMHDSAKAYGYIRLYEIYVDSIRTLNAADAVAKANALYNYSVQQKIASEEKSAADRARLMSAILVSVLIIVILIVFVVYSRIRAIRRAEIRGYKDNILLLEQTKRELNVLLENKQNEISDLIEEKTEAISELQERIKTYEKKIPAKYVNKGKAFTDNTITQRFYQLANKEMMSPSLKEWQEMKDFISVEMPELKALAHKCSLKDSEYEICILVLLGFSPSEMSILTERSKSDISNIRHRLYHKVTGEKGSPKDFDALIRRLL
ncbi:MAG: tetratricopeptide repeat protein [Prevotellaceae bacterium]|nr:tetratricopeptide repeat protein [Prevotellaceae bacterium]